MTQFNKLATESKLLKTEDPTKTLDLMSKICMVKVDIENAIKGPTTPIELVSKKKIVKELFQDENFGRLVIKLTLNLEFGRLSKKKIKKLIRKMKKDELKNTYVIGHILSSLIIYLENSKSIFDEAERNKIFQFAVGGYLHGIIQRCHEGEVKLEDVSEIEKEVADVKEKMKKEVDELKTELKEKAKNGSHEGEGKSKEKAKTESHKIDEKVKAIFDELKIDPSEFREEMKKDLGIEKVSELKEVEKDEINKDEIVENLIEKSGLDETEIEKNEEKFVILSEEVFNKLLDKLMKMRSESHEIGKNAKTEAEKEVDELKKEVKKMEKNGESKKTSFVKPVTKSQTGSIKSDIGLKADTKTV